MQSEMQLKSMNSNKLLTNSKQTKFASMEFLSFFNSYKINSIRPIINLQ